MQEKATIQHALKSVLELSDESFVKSLTNVLNDNKEIIKQLVSAYHYEERGKVEALEIEELKASTKTNGTFKVKYKTEYFLGCSDVHYEEKNNMLITYTLNIKDACIMLEGEYKPERLDEL